MKRMFRNLLLILLFLAPLDGFAMTSFAEMAFVSNAKVAGAPQVRVVFHEMYFISYLLTKAAKPGKPSADIINRFREAARKKNKVSFDTIAGFADNLPDHVNHPLFLKTYSHYLSDLRLIPEYDKLVVETHKYIEESLKEWDSNAESSFKFMSRLSGFKFGFELNVYVTHPSIGNGKSIWREGEKAIQFGAVPTFKNYFTVYIWHEILHLHMDKGSISHAVNQLLTDNDLRVHLNGGKAESFEGHSNLFPLMKALESDWSAYKKSPTDLNLFVSSVSKNEKIKSLAKVVGY